MICDLLGFNYIQTRFSSRFCLFHDQMGPLNSIIKEEAMDAMSDMSGPTEWRRKQTSKAQSLVYSIFI